MFENYEDFVQIGEIICSKCSVQLRIHRSRNKNSALHCNSSSTSKIEDTLVTNQRLSNELFVRESDLQLSSQSITKKSSTLIDCQPFSQLSFSSPNESSQSSTDVSIYFELEETN